jgi:hypothetical protein
MIKYNTYEIYECDDCGASVKMPPHNKKILPEGHKWRRKLSMEREEGKVKDPLKEAVV